MKIENTNLSPLSSKPTESARRIEKKDSLKDVRSVRAGQDKVEMSEDARLLAKARAALSNVDETEAADQTAKLATLRGQIESGDYTVQVNELARKLAAKFYPK
jgi:anti-sigma28 factor (negative regulator of flagellin synthesis)